MKKVKHKKRYTILYVSILLLIIVAFVSFYTYKRSLKPVAAEDDGLINIEVPPGSSNRDIGEILYNNQLIKNKQLFLLKVKLEGDTANLKAGNYNLSKSMDVNKIINSLVKGGKSGETVRFTIPEGLEVKDIASKLRKEEVIDEGKFLELASKKENFEDDFEFLRELDDGQSLEGFLFPSTYEVFKSDDEKVIINKMLGEFEKIYFKDIKDNMKDYSLNLNEIITLASIVEREAKLDKERTTIAAVFHNRLETDMNLGSCATVQYVLGERKERLTNKETRIDSPFNTYINTGLPPAPIASPGEKSIIATLNPEDVNYLYFVLTGDDGSHTFTETYKEHLEAGQKK